MSMFDCMLCAINHMQNGGQKIEALKDEKINCETCGKAEISADALKKIIKENMPVHLIQGYVRYCTDKQINIPQITASNLEKVFKNPITPKNHSEKLNSLLLKIDDESDYAGEKILYEYEIHYPFAFAKNEEEFRFIFNELVKLDFVDLTPMETKDGGSCQINLIHKGLEKIEELKLVELQQKRTIFLKEIYNRARGKPFELIDVYDNNFGYSTLLSKEEIEEMIIYFEAEGFIESAGGGAGVMVRLRHEGLKEIESRSIEKTITSANEMITESNNPKKLFVVHGRNEDARKALFDFLRALDLNPLEWTEAIALTEKGTPFVGEILEKAFSEAQAVIVLFTGDDLARLGTRFITKDETEEDLTPQPRPNVLFEAGMAFGTHPKRTILVQIGKIRDISDIAGRHIIHLNNSAEKRKELISRLKTAGCDFDDTHKMDWLSAGDFESCANYPDDEI